MIGLNHSVIYIHPFPPSLAPICYMSLLNSVTKNLCLGRKNIGRSCPRPSLPSHLKELGSQKVSKTESILSYLIHFIFNTRFNNIPWSMLCTHNGLLPWGFSDRILRQFFFYFLPCSLHLPMLIYPNSNMWGGKNCRATEGEILLQKCA